MYYPFQKHEFSLLHPVQEKPDEMNLIGRHQDLVYANDCHKLGESINFITKKNALLVTSTPAVLPENVEETKYVSMYRP
jgi:hypothetical protein